MPRKPIAFDIATYGLTSAYGRRRRAVPLLFGVALPVGVGIVAPIMGFRLEFASVLPGATMLMAVFLAFVALTFGRLKDVREAPRPSVGVDPVYIAYAAARTALSSASVAALCAFFTVLFMVAPPTPWVLAIGTGVLIALFLHLFARTFIALAAIRGQIEQLAGDRVEPPVHSGRPRLVG